MDTSGKVKLHIGNVPYEMKWQELKDLLRDRVGSDVYVEIFNGPDGRPSGVGVIEVSSAELAKKTIEVMHRTDIRGRQIIVREENEEDGMRRIHMGSGGKGNQPVVGARTAVGMGPVSHFSTQSHGMMGNTAPGSTDFHMQLLHDLGIDPANITNQVFIANLDYNVTAEKLEELFLIAGNVIQVELKMDKESNKFRGMATVRFEHPIESVQAISLFHGQRLFNRPMSVRLDRWNDVKSQNVPRGLPTGLESVGMGLGVGGQPLQNIGQIANSLSLTNLGAFLRSKVGPGGGGPMQQRGMPGMNPILDGGGASGPSAGGPSMNNLETIIAATVRAVTGQLGGLNGSSDGGMMRRNANPSAMLGMEMPGPAPTPFAMNRWSGGPNMAIKTEPVPGIRPGPGGMPSADAVRSGKLTADSDPNTLYVGNLPFSYTWQSLKDKFKEVGDVMFADVKSENGRPAGFGTVRFKNASDAPKAISILNGTIVDGRQIEVRWLNTRMPMNMSGF